MKAADEAGLELNMELPGAAEATIGQSTAASTEQVLLPVLPGVAKATIGQSMAASTEQVFLPVLPGAAEATIGQFTAASTEQVLLTELPRSSDPFYIVTYYLRWAFMDRQYVKDHTRPFFYESSRYIKMFKTF